MVRTGVYTSQDHLFVYPFIVESDSNNLSQKSIMGLGVLSKISVVKRLP